MLIGHPVFWIFAAAVLAPLLNEIPTRFKVPVVVFEVLLGMVIGPHGLDVIQFDGFVETMFTFGMAATLFMGGLDFHPGSVRQQRAHYQTGAVAQRVHSQQGVRRLMGQFDQATQFGG